MGRCVLLRLVVVAALATACAPPADALRPAARCSLDDLPLGPLHTEGGSFVDSDGRTVWLRGLNAGGRSKFAPFAPFDFPDAGYDAALQTYLDTAATLGVNILRVPYTWAAVEPSPGQLDEAFLGRYAALLDAAAARQLMTIVDFHQDVYAEALCGDGFPSWTLPSPGPPHHDCPSWFLEYGSDDDVKAAFDRFWSDDAGTQTQQLALWDQMAMRHASRTGVIGFELFNEPSNGSMDTTTWETTVLPHYYEVAGARVLAAAPHALVFVDVPGIEAVTQMTALTKPQVDALVFAPHYYDPAVLLIPDAALPTDVPAALERWEAVGQTWNVPVYVGEFGVQASRMGAGPYLRAHYDTFDHVGLSGSVWQYSAAAEGWNSEDLSIADADGGLYAAVADEIARPFLSRLAGDAGVVSFQPGNFQLSYQATAGGISEVRLPTRVYDSASVVVRTTAGVCIDIHDGRLLIKADAAGPVSIAVP